MFTRLLFVSLLCAVSTFALAAEEKADTDETRIDIGEIPIENEFEELSEESQEIMTVTANPVLTTCRLTNKKNDGFYRGARLTASNKTNRNKTCRFRCLIEQKNGRTLDFNCRATIKGNQTATVCSIVHSSYRLKKISSVSDSSPC